MLHASASMSIPPSISLHNRRSSDQEQRYFHLFQTHSAIDLTGRYFRSDFWTRVVLQASHADEAVRNAIVAIGALYKMVDIARAGLGAGDGHELASTSTTASGGSSSSSSSNSSSSRAPEVLHHFESALQHYQLAIRSQRRALGAAGGPQSRTVLKTSLISSLLFICFELFQGDWHAVQSQVVNGIRLLQSYRSPSSSFSSSSSSASSSVDGGGGNDTSLVRIDDRLELWRSGGRGAGAGVQDRIGEELCQVFARLETQLRSFDNGHPEKHTLSQLKPKVIPATPRGGYDGDDGVQRSSERFETLEDARRSWDLMMPKILDVYHRGSAYRYLASEDVPEAVREEVGRQLEEICSWNAAFGYMFEQGWKKQAESYRAGVSIMRINWLYAYIISATTLEPLETANDRMLLEFQEIVSLSAYVLQQKSFSLLGITAFLFDPTAVIPLFVVSLRCRFRKIRHAAIALLRTFRRREGIWDSVLGAEIGSWIADLEEDGLGHEQFVPESNRVRLCDVTFDLQKKLAWSQCGQPLIGTNEFTNLREINVSW